jgi:hypothetical protein
LAIEDSNTGAKSADTAGCTVLVVPNQVPVLDGPRRVFVDGSREHGAAELGAVLLEAAPPAHRALLRLPDPCSPGSVDGPERTVIREPSVSSASARTPTAPRHFGETMLGEDWQKCLDIAKGRPATELTCSNSASTIGRDGVADMNA